MIGLVDSAIDILVIVYWGVSYYGGKDNWAHLILLWGVIYLFYFYNWGAIDFRVFHNSWILWWYFLPLLYLLVVRGPYVRGL